MNNYALFNALIHFTNLRDNCLVFTKNAEYSIIVLDRTLCKPLHLCPDSFHKTYTRVFDKTDPKSTGICKNGNIIGFLNLNKLFIKIQKECPKSIAFLSTLFSFHSLNWL